MVSLIIHSKKLMVKGGLNSDITYILALNTIVPPLLNIVDPIILLKKY